MHRPPAAVVLGGGSFVASNRGDTRQVPDTMVDTGGEYTWVPWAPPVKLGITVECVERFVLPAVASHRAHHVRRIRSGS